MYLFIAGLHGLSKILGFFVKYFGFLERHVGSLNYLGFSPKYLGILVKHPVSGRVV